MLEVGKEYDIIFAGSCFKAKYVREGTLYDGTEVYIFNDGKYNYPITKKNSPYLCGNSKQ